MATEGAIAGAEGRLEELAKSYGGYVGMGGLAVLQARQGAAQVEARLTKMDELTSLVAGVRVESARTFGEALPELVEQARQVERIFGLVEELEGFMRQVAHSAREMDLAIARAEAGQVSLQRRKGLSAIGLGAISAKYLPVRTASAMPAYEPFPLPPHEEFFAAFRSSHDGGAAAAATAPATPPYAK